MKKILSLLLVLAILLGFAGCMPSEVLQVTTEPSQATVQTETTAPEETEPAIPESEPEPTQAPTEAPKPKPTQPKPTEPEDTRPRPTEEQETHPQETEPEETTPAATQTAPQKSYTGKEEVAAYIAKYGHLPDNFITKSKANALGWKSGSLEKYAPGKCIGGDRFYNREGLLPGGKIYYECDIDTLGKSKRGSKRIVFSSDGEIYYTSDHYASFQRYLGPNRWEDV